MAFNRFDGEYGSSPRVWGTFKDQTRTISEWRFIPTCVGNIPLGNLRAQFRHGSSPRVWGTCSKSIATGQLMSVHPHVCGEHLPGALLSFAHTGSSPRVWGTCIITSSTASFAPVHPHVCGEHCPPKCWKCFSTGSSPRVWGTSEEFARTLPDWRFIPTCVGNIFAIFSQYSRSTVHPHVCGEHQHPHRPRHRPPRFIPTCVGNICVPPGGGKVVSGSSPRVWGTFVAKPIGERPCRFIPTCVGNI